MTKTIINIRVSDLSNDTLLEIATQDPGYRGVSSQVDLPLAGQPLIKSWLALIVTPKRQLDSVFDFWLEAERLGANRLEG